jgi:hypothetical protein
MGTTLMLASRRGGGFSETDRLLAPAQLVPGFTMPVS